MDNALQLLMRDGALRVRFGSELTGKQYLEILEASNRATTKVELANEIAILSAQRGVESEVDSVLAPKQFWPMQFRLRSLLIVLAIVPPLLAVAWARHQVWQEQRSREAQIRAIRSRPFPPVTSILHSVPIRLATPDDAEPRE